MLPILPFFGFEELPEKVTVVDNDFLDEEDETIDIISEVGKDDENLKFLRSTTVKTMSGYSKSELRKIRTLISESYDESHVPLLCDMVEKDEVIFHKLGVYLKDRLIGFVATTQCTAEREREATDISHRSLRNLISVDPVLMTSTSRPETTLGCYIVCLCVGKLYQRKRVGSLLLSHLINNVSRTKPIFIRGIEDRYSPMLKLFQFKSTARYGFKVTSEPVMVCGSDKHKDEKFYVRVTDAALRRKF